ncbi:hypothetical protein GCM10025783_27760 [Amnibacterium soli]|uniref:O-antigen ligase-related domain-containing protein n=1 Tax=Amnibacterium soli TaxID=1282736 RepID=A0ABP8ZDC5_9MICO
MILLAAGAGVAFVVWALIAAPVWVRRCRETGGHWALSGIVYLSGPINAVIQLTYPGGTPGGFSLLLARGNTIAAWTLGIVALLSALRNPRRGPGLVLLVVAVLAFYGALLLSSVVGYQPATPPEEYFITPVLVLPFLLHGGYEWRWLVVVLRRALRAIVVLSLVSVPLLPGIAYDQECCRELFGIERIQGITGHPNTLAILACFAVILELRGGRLRWLVPELAAMLVAQSTTSWVALAIGLLVIAGRLGRTTRIVAITVGLCAIVFALTDRQLVNDFFPPEFWTFTGRTTIWQAALAGFFLSPFTGYGPNLLDAQYRAQYLGVFDAAGQAHNQIVQTLGGTGLIGLVCLVAVLLGLVRVASRAAGTTAGLSVALVVAFGARLLSETPLNPQGSTATLLLLVAVFGVASSGAAPRTEPRPDPETSAAPPKAVEVLS